MYIAQNYVVCICWRAKIIAIIMNEMNDIKIVHFDVHNRQPPYRNLSHFSSVQIFTLIRNRFAEKR
jgi:hypothetical protein